VTPDRVPAGTRPSTSSGNYPPGTTRANFVVAPVGDDGAVHIYNNRGRIQVIADVVGYITRGLPEASCTGRVVPLELAFRAFDTRQREFGSTPLSHGSAEDWSFENFKESVTIGGAPVGELSGVFGNLTGVGLKRLFPCCPVNTFIAMYPGNLTSRPNVSNVNLGEGKAVPNMSLLTFGTSGDDDYVVTAYNNFGSVHYLLDVYAIVLD
jgi:hypothetical protein